jgi:NTE family protein
MDYVAIFEGGGAKGIGHIGALKATEERNISFSSIGGTSAGAIIAAFISAGFTADELFNPKNIKTSLFSIDLLSLLDNDTWNTFEALRLSIEELKESSWMKTKLFLLYRKHKDTINYIISNKGLFNTEKFIDWLEAELQKKLGLNRHVLFDDLPIPLTIISTNVTGCTIKSYSKEKTPKDRVSLAVSSSIAIPLFFQPSVKENLLTLLVDGGIVSNYPTWIFDTERENNEGGVVTLGYKLIENEPRDKNQEISFNDYILRLFNTALWGDQALEVRGIENLHSIPLHVSTKTLNFNMSPANKVTLYNEGKNSAELYFVKHIGLGHKEDVSQALNMLSMAAKTLIEKKSGRSLSHIRCNIFIPTFQDSTRLRLVYSYGMENDSDDRLVIESGCGAAGECYSRGKPVICDLVKAAKTFKTKWKLNKYQQAMIRGTLKSLISLPLFNPKDGSVIAVLSFDSDDDILDTLKEIETELLEFSPIIYKVLIA